MTTFNFHSFTERENLIGVAWAYLRNLRPHLTLTALRDALEQHPDYPSLLSLGDTLDRYHIENAALRIDAEQLALLQVPYIAHLRTNGGTFVMVESATGEAFTYHNEKGKRITETREDFLKKWSGVVFIAEPTEASGEKDYATKRQKEQLENLRWPLIIAGFVLLTAVGIFQSPNLSTGVLLGLKATGILLTALLLSVQYGKTNDFTDSLCRLNQKTDCNHILTSPAAKITSWLGWSEVGFFYFMGGWIALIIAGEAQFDIRHSEFVILSMLALPYTFWSIWYQWRVAKQWCPLCIAVQVVIWAEVAVGSLEMMEVNPVSLLPTMDYRLWTSFLPPILLWLIIKPLLQKSQDAERWRGELRRFKNNPALFEALLNQQKQMPSVPADLQPLILGNPAAEHTITMVTNPYCGPCAKAHIQLEEVLAENPNLKAQIIFAVCHDSDGRKTKVVKHMISLSLLVSEERIRNGIEAPIGGGPSQGLGAWYAQATKSYDTWAAQYPADVSIVPDNIIAAHCEWTKMVNIEGTPSFFVDGRKLPELYGLTGASRLMQHLTTDLAESI